MRRRQGVLIAAALAVGCSAPATLPALEEAETLEKAGDQSAALAQYDRAIESCVRIANPRERARDCAASHLHRAELLVTMERTAAAVAAYEAIERALPDDETATAEGLYRAGTLRLRNGDEVGGYQQLWRCVTDFPDEQFAGDALRVVVTDGRRRNPTQLYAVLSSLASALASTRVADNVLYFLAELAEAELEEPATALANYDRVWNEHPKSGLFDESLWRGAKLCVALANPAGAVKRLRVLLATREVAFGAGSYFSVWLDDAQLELGRILRDEIGDLGGAAAAFETLPRDYPASILRDDALYELAVTRSRAGETRHSCEALARLRRDFPDSKHELERAPALRATLRCADSKGSR